MSLSKTFLQKRNHVLRLITCTESHVVETGEDNVPRPRVPCHERHRNEGRAEGGLGSGARPHRSRGAPVPPSWATWACFFLHPSSGAAPVPGARARWSGLNEVTLAQYRATATLCHVKETVLFVERLGHFQNFNSVTQNSNNNTVS